MFNMGLLGAALHGLSRLLFGTHMELHAESIRHDVEAGQGGRVLRALAAYGSTLATLLLFTASAVVQWIPRSDALFALVIAAVLALQAFPALSGASRVLLVSVPSTLRSLFEQNVRDAEAIEGVLAVRPQLWTLSPGSYVASLHVHVQRSVDEEAVRERVRSIFAPYIRHLTIEVAK